MNLWLDQRAADDILQKAQHAFPLETGGLLVGYMTGRGPVVTNLIGPGPGAKATRTSFVPDAEFQQRELNRIYEQSEGQDTYLGDWHTHPEGVPALSRRDRRTLASIVRHATARLPQATMLIAGGSHDDWEFGAFIAQRRPWWGVGIAQMPIASFLARAP